MISHSCNSASSTGQNGLPAGFRDNNFKGFIGTTRTVDCNFNDIKFMKAVMKRLLKWSDISFKTAIKKVDTESGIVLDRGFFIKIFNFRNESDDDIELLTPASIRASNDHMEL